MSWVYKTSGTLRLPDVVQLPEVLPENVAEHSADRSCAGKPGSAYAVCLGLCILPCPLFLRALALDSGFGLRVTRPTLPERWVCAIALYKMRQQCLQDFLRVLLVLIWHWRRLGFSMKALSPDAASSHLQPSTSVVTVRYKRRWRACCSGFSTPHKSDFKPLGCRQS